MGDATWRIGIRRRERFFKQAPSTANLPPDERASHASKAVRMWAAYRGLDEPAQGLQAQRIRPRPLPPMLESGLQRRPSQRGRGGTMQTGIDPNQLRDLIVAPTLRHLDPEIPYSDVATELLML